MTARGEGFGGVSHELRTPLSGLTTTVDVLALHRDELSPAAREATGMVQEDVAELTHLVENLLEVSELESGRAAVRKERVDLRALCAAVVKKRRRDCPVRGPALITCGDKVRLERIVGNLVENAYDHGQGRDVQIEIADAGMGTAEVSVTDAGPGMDAEDVPHLFERFYRADPSRSRGHGGIGMGLAIASENARLLGGALRAESSPAQGATFTLSVPLERASSPATA